ncbi:MAG: hypothetical protein V1822_04275 [Candidatus Micrarchaeota archaeon]
MLSFEAAISSLLVLMAFALLLAHPQGGQNQLVQFYNFMQASDYAAIMAPAPCDFSKISPDPNFCYECSLSSDASSGVVVQAYGSCKLNQNEKISASRPVFSGGQVQKMVVSKSSKN